MGMSGAGGEASSIDYHLRELGIANDPNDSRHVMPPLSGASRILDLGCGIGQTLVAARVGDSVLAIGIDVDLEALRFGRRKWGGNYVAGRGEALPFGDESFDCVIARVSLPYTHIPSVVREVHRVLTAGGTFWMVLHSLRKTARQLADALKHFALRPAAIEGGNLVSGFCFHTFGCLPSLPPGANRYRSFQTQGRMRKTLQRAGFEVTAGESASHFIITATKKAGAGLARAAPASKP